MAQQWHERDSFIGPMRFDPTHPDQCPYLETSGGDRQSVRDGDWIVRDSYGRYSVSPASEFEERFESSN
jgi:hypothetical protein